MNVMVCVALGSSCTLHALLTELSLQWKISQERCRVVMSHSCTKRVSDSLTDWRHHYLKHRLHKHQARALNQWHSKPGPSGPINGVDY